MSVNTLTGSLQEAADKLRQVSATVAAVGHTAKGAVQEGRSFEELSKAALGAAEYVTAAAEHVRAHPQVQGLPIDRVLFLLSQALTAASAISDRAQQWDAQHGASVKLYGAIEDAVQKSYGALLRSREQASAIQLAVASQAGNALGAVRSQAATMAEAVTAQAGAAAAAGAATAAAGSAGLAQYVPLLAAAATSLHELSTTLASAELAFLADARAKVAAAAEEVRASGVALRTAPLAEVPVAAALQALHLARTAVGTVTALVAGQAGALTAPLASTLAAGRDAAAAAVTTATQELTHAREQLAASAGHHAGVGAGALGLAKRAADRGVDLAIRQAAAWDTSLDISGKVASLDRSLSLQDRAWTTLAAAQALASDLDARYKVTDAAAGLLDRAKAVDEAVIGGRGAALATKSAELAGALAGETVDYLKGVAAKFEATKAEIGATGTAGGGSRSASPAAVPQQQQQQQQQAAADVQQ